MFVGKLDKAVGDDELAALFAHIGGICSASVKRHGDNKSKKWGYYYNYYYYYCSYLELLLYSDLEYIFLFTAALVLHTNKQTNQLLFRTLHQIDCSATITASTFMFV